ncbi:hypothetical protein [Hydrogenoanaerobacterium sp.]|uniref:hypothetical protein n=1 Tax=Hydrogenoanaerobacterium sp. TaxID=2953763 RepID=UPI0028988375|nr:hypothetical protein [Hydrogenoanaerobacterium sp.]
MADKKEKGKGLSPTFRVIAALYILYLAFGLIKDFGQVPSNQRVFIGITIVVFIAAPIWFLISAFRDIKDQKAQEEAQRAAESEQLADDEDDEDEDEDEDAVLDVDYEESDDTIDNNEHEEKKIEE